MKRGFLLLLLITALTSCLVAKDTDEQKSVLPKYEFRGAWMHIIGQKQYAQMTPQQTQEYLINQLF